MLEATIELLLANPAHVRAIPGRKSDMNDAMWLADLMAHGLIRGSFVPPPAIQEIRDLTRTRKQLVRRRRGGLSIEGALIWNDPVKSARYSNGSIPDPP
ncbi:MAG: transposase [Acidobacteria bacterium]|nr:transposase [Acidobacteriota bacterium]